MKKFIKTIIKWLGTSKILSAPRRCVGRILNYYYLNKGMVSISVNILRAPEVFDLIKQIKEETEMFLGDLEAYQIYMTVRKTEKINGDIAEVGVYKGGSAKLMREATKKPIHLFDTFEGLPDLCENDNPEQFHKGDYSASFESIKSYLKNYPNISFYKGFFPSTAEPVKNKRFSFVHLDVDIYESTLNCLKFFYPRISGGGIIISHDYPGSKGVKKAFDEFFEDKPEIIIELFGTRQCLIVKV
ncbi:MAG: TylF/MycF/NovP-related O-methyltransferase [Candidatus Beckwithbacteria bacterium]